MRPIRASCETGMGLQERLLARRTLHFSKTKVSWEWKTKLAWEYFSNGLPYLLRCEAAMFKKTEELDWEKTLDSYTSASLTYGRDRPVALAGIAKRFQQINNDHYLAGI